jgi:hypothetical protein
MKDDDDEFMKNAWAYQARAYSPNHCTDQVRQANKPADSPLDCFVRSYSNEIIRQAKQVSKAEISKAEMFCYICCIICFVIGLVVGLCY